MHALPRQQLSIISSHFQPPRVLFKARTKSNTQEDHTTNEKERKIYFSELNPSIESRGTKREKFVCVFEEYYFERGSHSRVEREEVSHTTKRAQHEKKPKTLPLPQVRYRIVACLVTSSSPVPLKDPPCRVAMRVKSVELKRPPVGVVVRRGGASSGVVHVT
ncbi:hypothetical protein TNCV_4051141 [Trichonephila clavipes]|nr:hypothetical protein TNCV_4051141 [Trichonephila clavipes]